MVISELLAAGDSNRVLKHSLVRGSRLEVRGDCDSSTGEHQASSNLEPRTSNDRGFVSSLLASPPDMVTMAVGALIRAGLVRGIQRNLAIVVRLRKSLHPARFPGPTKGSL